MGMTYVEISDYLKSDGIERGCSERTIRRFCKDNNINRTLKVSTEERNDIIREAVGNVGWMYGRKMMGGYLRSQNIRLSEKEVREGLNEVNPRNHHL